MNVRIQEFAHNMRTIITVHITNKLICCIGCPGDFTSIASVNGCYKVVNRNLQWIAAREACRSLHQDAHLLVINDAKEQAAVAAMLEASSQCNFNVFDSHVVCQLQAL